MRYRHGLHRLEIGPAPPPKAQNASAFFAGSMASVTSRVGAAVAEPRRPPPRRPAAAGGAKGCPTCNPTPVREQDDTQEVVANLASDVLGPRRPNLEPIDPQREPVTNIVVEAPGAWYVVDGHGIASKAGGKVDYIETGGSRDATGYGWAQDMDVDTLAKTIRADPGWGHREVFLLACRGADVAPELARKLGVPVIASHTDVDVGFAREIATIPDGPDAGRRWVVPRPLDGRWSRFDPGGAVGALGGGRKH